MQLFLPLFVLMLRCTENNNVPKTEAVIETLFTALLRLMYEIIALTVFVNRRLKFALDTDFIIV